MNTIPDRSALLALYSYDAIKEVLTYKRATCNAKKPGDRVGWKDRYGYICLELFGSSYKAHRIIWKMVHGTDTEIIDHINRDKSDNRISNLRSVSQAVNMSNLSRCRKGKLSGVWYDRERESWQVYISRGGRRINTGRFKTLLDAASARISKFNELEFTK